MPRPLDLIPALLDGLVVTLQLTFGGGLLALAMAWIAGLAECSSARAVRWTAGIYIEVFRGTSALVQLFWFFYALPLFGVSLSPMAAGVLVLGLNIGAYGAEVVRGAIQSIDPGQIEAATALNMNPYQRMRRVIMPQALVGMIPPAGNLLIELLKSTALVSLITLSDLTFTAMQLRAETLRTAEIFGVLLLVYFAVALVLTTAVRRLERRVKRGWHLEASA